jgi:AraC family transcriptional regulator, regulatory protein of adaptative response / methylated-DNA-[protein]-cysteine methyltransferase
MFNKVIKDIQKIEDRRVLRALTKAAGIPKMEISIHKCLFGHVLIGTYENYVKAVELGKDSDECYRNFINRWSNISLSVEDRKNNNIAEKVLKVIETGIIDTSFQFSFYDIGTYLQRKIWDAINTIEPGKTVSYKDIAIQIGNPKAVRAVGTACGANPIAIIVPCHRVVKSDGGEGGYRWGLEIKRKLLQREASTNGI